MCYVGLFLRMCTIIYWNDIHDSNFSLSLQKSFLVKNLSLLKNHNEISLHTCLNGSYPKDTLSCFSCVQLFATPWIVACQIPLSMGFSRQEEWSGLLFPSPGDLPESRVEPASLMSPALAGGFTSSTWKITNTG